MPKVSAPEIVRGLVARFDRSRDSYLAGGINEMQLRREFLFRCWEPSAVSRKPIAHLRQIAATDKEIDQLVYELYGLTDDEVRIVEGS
jgi:hypothetical protein